MEVAKKIGLFLCHAGISQTDLSRKTGISQTKLGRTFAGKRRFTFEEYENICRALGVGAATFLEARAPEPKQKPLLKARYTKQ